MKKKTIAIIFGGQSEEHDISVKSAAEIAKNIDKNKYNPIYIGITREGVWFKCEEPCADWQNTACVKAIIPASTNFHALIFFKGNETKTQHIDVVFPVLHGKFGEDGSIQGLLQLSGIPYIGCKVHASALCFDKQQAYFAVKNAGISVPRFQSVICSVKANIKVESYPVFVKPARSGSSFGVTKVNCEEELEGAIQHAAQYDDKVLIEEAIAGIEVGCAVLGNGDDLTVGEVDEIKLSHGFFKIHQEKNPEKGSDNSQIAVPANLSPEVRDKIKETAKEIYSALGCMGLARVDMFLQADGRIVLNEVNTMPGFTSYSRYPRMMAAAGMPLTEIIDELIRFALEDDKQKQNRKDYETCKKVLCF